MINLVKTIVASLLCTPFFINRVFANKTVVLMYHRVLPDSVKSLLPCQESIIIYESEFRKQLSFLARYFEVISLSDFVDNKHEGKNKPQLVITFDDGWKDNILYAMPVLKSFELQASMFVTTGVVGSGKVFWWRILEDVLSREYVDEKTVEALSLTTQAADLASRISRVCMGEERVSLIDSLIEYLKTLSPAELDDLCIRLSEEHNSFEYNQMMDWEDVKVWVNNGMEVGPHSVNHHLLTEMDYEDAVEEINQSYSDLSCHVAKPLKGFCYPNGNYTNDLEKYLQDNDFRFSLSTISGVANNEQRFLLPRINVSSKNSSTPLLLLFRIIKNLLVK